MVLNSPWHLKSVPRRVVSLSFKISHQASAGVFSRHYILVLPCFHFACGKFYFWIDGIYFNLNHNKGLHSVRYKVV